MFRSGIGCFPDRSCFLGRATSLVAWLTGWPLRRAETRFVVDTWVFSMVVVSTGWRE